MKKLLTAVAVLAVASVAPVALGQGLIAFANTSSTLISTNGSLANPSVSGVTGIAKADGAVGYSFGVWYGAAGNMDASTYTFAAYGTNLPSAGRLNGGTFAISGVAAGTSVQAVVRGWNSALAYQGFNGTAATAANAVMGFVANPASAASIQAVKDAGGFWYGQSAIGTFILGGGAQPTPTLFGNPPAAGQIGTGFTMSFVPVPEPSTLALAGLGAASLLIFRRRK